MLNKDKKDKVKPVVWSSGRGGAGNISKTKNEQKRVPIDPDIRPQKRVLELETARNRSTAGGRGGSGNRYDHVLEAGLFQRIMQYESARIVATKAEKEANKSIKIDAPRTRNESVSGEDATSSLRGSRTPTRLRSVSVSTFATSISGSSSNASSTTQQTRPSSIASRFFSPWKKRSFGRTSDCTSISTDNTSLRSSTPIAPFAIPEHYPERSSSLYALPTKAIPTTTTSNLKASGSIEFMNHGSSTSFDMSPPTPDGSCSPPRLGPVQPLLPCLDQPRVIVLPSGDRVFISDRDLKPMPRSLSNVDVSTTASQIDRRDGYPFLYGPEPQGRRPPSPPFTAYHLPLRPNIAGRHSPTRRCEGVRLL